MIKTSVIIPVYNRPHLLRYCLISLINQSLLPHEVIVTDDGSREDMISVLREFSSEVMFKLKYVKQQDKGFRLARCRNNGVRFADGDYLIFLDQDLIFTKNLLQTFVRNQAVKQFNVCYPLRLTREQTDLINEDVIAHFRFDPIFQPKQINKIKKQYRKDKFYYYLKKLHLRYQGAKFRGGAVGINLEDFIKINGYDENYIGWGNEDDDLGSRLYRINCSGQNISFDDFPIHLYHDPFHNNGERVNLEYHNKNKTEIDRGRFRAKAGFENPINPDEIIYKTLN